MSLQSIKKFAALAIVSSLVASPAQAQPATAEPAGRWALDYAEMSCSLQRTFNAGGTDHLLRFERKPGSELLILSILSDEKGPASDQTGEGQLVLDSGAVIPVRVSRVPLAERRPRYSFVIPARQANLGTVKNGIAIDAGSIVALRFETGTLETPVAALDQCITDLYSELGIDAAALANIASYPRLDTGRLLRYLPDESYDADKGGGIEGMLQVDAQGQITNCTLTKPQDAKQHAELCAIIRDKARVEPAKGQDGQAIAAPLFFEVSAVRRGRLFQR
ncbi:hypothetical protein [Sphingomicrobium flavum]|uniref:hypothetical protein n=1 Tax=Sphingomicrobium flavum TaxID=1229164 RepID=UPI0021ADDE65|nr:hypothetical protein [Sphingomicrobium flavum]